jgi:hypothetical protein
MDANQIYHDVGDALASTVTSKDAVKNNIFCREIDA